MQLRRFHGVLCLRRSAELGTRPRPRRQIQESNRPTQPRAVSAALEQADAAHATAASPWATPRLLAAFLAVASAISNRIGPPGIARADQEAPTADCDAPRLDGEEQELVNWSGTHFVKTARYYQPETLNQLKDLVAEAHATGEKLRPVGSALSPNALAFCSGGMVNLSLMDSVLSIDKEKMQVTVQAGARVSQVVEALRPYGMTLQNYASIAEQQIGGFIQVGAHGTGATIPPVDEQVVALKLITPGAGEVDLAAGDDDPMLFKLARTALGLLGVVAEVTLQCVPAHLLVEKTFVASHADVRKHHASWLRSNRHLRYMWIPYTDAVVVVTCNPTTPASLEEARTYVPRFSESYRLMPARDLLKSVDPCPRSNDDIENSSFTSLRDTLLAVDPLNPEWVKRVNEAEAEFWRRSEGVRVDASDRVLGFDCGGQQWVSEVVIPVENNPDDDAKSVDVEFVTSILKLIEERHIPAPSPIEQRWTAPSTSPLSPACERRDVDVAPLYSWVGIIMYLPDVTNSSESEAVAVEETRSRITSAFLSYKNACAESLWDPYRASEHWAKIELPGPEDTEGLQTLQARVARKYPVATFNTIRRQLFDPKGILTNSLSEGIFGME
jgi:L-galactono-1,4-lactone dehydrogenase